MLERVKPSRMTMTNIAKKKVLSLLRPYLPKRLFAELEKPLAQHWYEKIGRRRQMSFFANFVKPGELCFDVGANIGTLAGIFLDLGARVVAIEPQPECAAALRLQYGDRLVAVVQVALSSRDGQAEMFVCDESVSSTLSARFVSTLENSQISEWFRARRFGQPITVHTTTLDGLIEKYGLPSFCKIDVEGFEHEVISGLSHPIERMSLEYTGEDLEPVVRALDRIDGLGNYYYNYTTLGRPHFELDRWCSPSDIRRHLQRISRIVATGDVYAVRTESPTAMRFKTDP